ncbi:phage terminase large subunit [Shimia sp.]|uniref:phage terminase large subunit n=1 Tax=Shimia sp. TaxID=1954381 RepID=UPI003BAAB83E
MKDPLYSFENFLYLVWKHLRLPDPTPVQYDIARFLEDHSNSRICIEAFRGVGKSWVTSAYVLWELYRNPELKIMVVSASKNRADNFTTFTLQLINDIPQLRHLMPTPKQRQSRVEFDVGPAKPDQTPSVFSRGIDSQLTGGRADIIVSDDVEVMNNSMTVERRDLLQEKLKEYSAILKPFNEMVHNEGFQPRIVYLGTPQTEDSIYNKLPETFVKRIWPALVPTKEEVVGYGNDLAPMIQAQFASEQYGEPTDPDRFDADELIDRRAEYGAAGFQLQFMLNTSLSDEERYPLKVKNLVVAEVPPKEAPMDVYWMPNPDRQLKDLPNLAMGGDNFYSAAGFAPTFSKYQQKILAIDPSGRGADETGYAVLFQLNGYIWCPEAGGLQGGYDDATLETLAMIAKKHDVDTVVYESNFGDGMFGKLLEPILLKHHRCGIEEVRNHQMKEMRIIDVLEPVISNHRLIVAPSVIQGDYDSAQKFEGEMRRVKTLVFQMTRICRERGALRKDDRIDVLAIGVGFFVEVMNQDAEKKEAKERNNRLLKELLAHKKTSLSQSWKKRNRKKWV